MAGIDKMYGNRKQYNQLKGWLKNNAPQFLEELRAKPSKGVQDGVIANFSEKADVYLYSLCGLDFVQERLKEQYGGKNPLYSLTVEAFDRSQSLLSTVGCLIDLLKKDPVFNMYCNHENELVAYLEDAFNTIYGAREEHLSIVAALEGVGK